MHITKQKMNNYIKSVVIASFGAFIASCTGGSSTPAGPTVTFNPSSGVILAAGESVMVTATLSNSSPTESHTITIDGGDEHLSITASPSPCVLTTSTPTCTFTFKENQSDSNHVYSLAVSDSDSSTITSTYQVSIVGVYNDVWISGSNTINELAVYGTLGESSTFYTPGARSEVASWTDTNGNFWLFGGQTNNGTAAINDLWKFNPTSRTWTWMSGSKTLDSNGNYGTQGVESTTNVPSARRSPASWTDESGNLWLFGGYQSAVGGYKNDLWRYNPTNSQWTWMKGPKNGKYASYGIKGVESSTNIPGGRVGDASWTDESGNLWLFGGYGYNSNSSGQLNDLWKFNPNTNNWTWVSGSNLGNQAGVYGTKGQESASNVPGGRNLVSGTWVDASNNLWLFGGSTPGSDYNDLWKFNTTTSNWTWMSGESTPNESGVYGIIGIPNSSNIPGARYGSVAIIGKNGMFYLFGGIGYASTGIPDNLNDIWRYNPATNQWTWLKGSNVTNAFGVYGDIGVAKFSNQIGARQEAAGFRDLNGDLWIFGGLGYDSKGELGYLNDLWMYNTPD